MSCATASGEVQLWSIGASEAGLLGQGSSKKQAKSWGKLDYDSAAVTMVDVSVYADHAIACDSEGSLWAWGNNADGKCGHYEEIQ